MEAYENPSKRKEPVMTGAKLCNSPFDHVQRWAAIPEGKLQVLEAYRAAQTGNRGDYLTRAPDCIQIYNVVGVTENGVFDNKEADVWKRSFKPREAKHAVDLPKGLEIRSSIFEALKERRQKGDKMHVLINAYVLPKRLAYDLGIRVNARAGRCRKRKKLHGYLDEVPAKRIVEEEVEVSFVEDLSDEIMELSIEEHVTEVIRPEVATTTVRKDLVDRPPQTLGSKPESSIYTIVEEVRRAGGATIGLNTISYDPRLILNISSKIQLKNSFKLGWDPTHECRKIRKMADPQAVQLLICAVKACNTGSARKFPKAQALLNIPKVKTMFLKIVKFHKTYKHFYSLFMSCLAKWEQCVALKETKKPVPEKVPALNVSQHNISTEMDSMSEGFSQMSQLSLLGIPTVTQVMGRNGTIKTKLRGRNALKRQRDEARLKATTSMEGSVPYKPILSTISQMLSLSGIDKLLGSRKNCRGVLRFFKRCVFLGGNRCQLPLKYLMDELSVEGMEWIPNIMPKEESLFLLAKIAKWVVEDFVCMVLQTVFYVTETTSGRNQLAFFKKSRWVSITEAVKHKYRQKSDLAPVDDATEVNAKLRFVPKKNGGVRPICAFTKQHKLKIGMEKSKFKESMMLLKYLAAKCAPLSSLDTTHFYCLWKNFVHDWKAVGCPKLYYLKTDIANAFPAVNVELLRKILKDFGAKVGNLWIESYKRENDNLKHVNPKWRHSYKDFVVDALKKKNRYVAERPWQKWKYHRYQPLDAKAALKPILASLDPAVVKLGRKKYAFRQGLLQGSIASQLLCTIYYGYLEQHHIGSFFNEQKSELFLRVVDDYIFVSTEKDRVQSLLKLMISTKDSSQQSVAEFNLNVEKTKHNLNLSSVDNELDAEITFWGYRLFLRTGHVGRDYSSYENADMCTTVSCNIRDKLVGREIVFISERMKFLGSLRLAQMMFDSNINCETQVLRNLMNAGCMTAFRLYALIRMLYSDLAALDRNEMIMKELFAGIFSFALRLVRFGVKMGDQSSRSHKIGSTHCCECESWQNNTVSHEFVRKLLNKLEKLKKERKLAPEILMKNKFLLAVVYGMYLKLIKHQTTFRSFLLPKLEEWMGEIIIRLGYNRSSLLFQWLPSALPTEFEKMKK